MGRILSCYGVPLLSVRVGLGSGCWLLRPGLPAGDVVRENQEDEEECSREGKDEVCPCRKGQVAACLQDEERDFEERDACRENHPAREGTPPEEEEPGEDEVEGKVRGKEDKEEVAGGKGEHDGLGFKGDGLVVDSGFRTGAGGRARRGPCPRSAPA